MALARSAINRPWPGQRVLAFLAGFTDSACVWCAQIRKSAEVTIRQLNHVTETLLSNGYIERCYYFDGPRKRGGYRITAAGIAAHQAGLTLKAGSGQKTARATPGARSRAWGVMRYRRKFGMDDLEMLCANGQETSLRNNLSKYVSALTRAGFCQPLRQNRWLLVRDAGPQAPIWSARKGTVTDPNTGVVYDI